MIAGNFPNRGDLEHYRIMHETTIAMMLDPTLKSISHVMETWGSRSDPTGENGNAQRSRRIATARSNLVLSFLQLLLFSLRETLGE